jgi:hypothetical protein
MNYIKIELDNGIPYFSMEYDSLASFRDLVYTIISSDGPELFCATLENDLTKKNKKDELDIFNLMRMMLKEGKEKFINSEEKEYVINPASFK